MTTDTFTASLERSHALEASIADHPQRHRMLTGDRPTGHLHIGHYLGSLRNRVTLQDGGIESFVLIADYQVITDREGIGPIRDNVLSLIADYLAAGIDPARSTIFTHSATPALNQLIVPFLALVTVAELERNPTV
jgi:tryptophanyl-tRNA synthetase